MEFKDEQEWSPAREMAFEMLKQLEKAGLITERFTEGHVRTLLDGWQIPMYHIEFSAIQVTLERLRERREAEFNYQFGKSDTGY